MSARGHKRITIGEDNIEMSTLSQAAGGPVGAACDAIRVHGVGSVWGWLEGQRPENPPSRHQFHAAGEGLGLRLRTIRGTGGDPATASTAMDVDLYWSV